VILVKYIIKLLTLCFDKIKNSVSFAGTTFQLKLNISPGSYQIFCYGLLVLLFQITMKILITYFTLETLNLVLTLGIYRLFNLIVLYVIFNYIKTLPLVLFFSEYSEEQDLFFLERNHPILVFLRTNRNLFLFLSLLSFFGSTVLYYEYSNVWLSNGFLILSILCIMCTLVQSAVFIRKVSFLAPSEALLSKYSFMQKRGVWTKIIPLFRPAGELVRLALSICIGTELLGKLSNGSINSIPGYRQDILNNVFPNDKTKIWDEYKAARAFANKSCGLPHDASFIDWLIHDIDMSKPISRERSAILQAYLDHQSELHRIEGSELAAQISKDALLKKSTKP